MPELTTRSVSALPAGTTLNRYLRVLEKSHGDMYAAQMNAEEYRDTPLLHAAFTELMMKAATAPGTTVDEAWAKPLVSTGIAREALELMRGQSIVAQVLPRARQVPFGIRVPIDETATAIGDWIVEAGPTPVVALNFSAGVALDATKLGCIVTLTRELVRSGAPGAEATVRRALLSALAKTIDQKFLDPTYAAATDKPGSITNGATAVTSSGTTAAAISTDLAAMIAAITTSGQGLTWIMKKKTAATIGGALGAASGLPASLAGLPVVVSDNSPAQVTLVDSASLLFADDGGLAIQESEQTMLQSNNAPDHPVTASTTLISVFQTNLVAFKVLRWINWQRVVTGAVSYMPVAY